MLLRHLPDLGNHDVRQSFQAKWGQENCVLYGRTRYAEFNPGLWPLSIKAAWGGIEHCQINGRLVGIDDDNFLIVNQGRLCTVRIHSQRPVESLTICFRPGLAERTYGAMIASVEEALDACADEDERATEFTETLQPHNRTVTPVLRFIKAHLLLGLDDEMWYEEQLQFLLERMLAHRARLLAHVDELKLVRAGTRREVFRRIGFATDFLHTNYTRPIDLDELARVSFLSKYHFVRLFRLVHGLTPFDYLQRKRITVAVRLLQSGRLTMNQVAASVGLAERSTVRRQIRKWTGLSLQQLRRGIARSRTDGSAWNEAPSSDEAGTDQCEAPA